MSTAVQETDTTTPRPARGRTVALLAAGTGLALAPWLAGVLVPYYVNDLDALPLAELTSGAHDPKDLWPRGTLGGLVQAGGLFSLLLTPMGLLLVLLAGALPRLGSRARRGTPGVTVGLVLVTLACLAGLAAVWSPLGMALMTWRLD
ncbi:hypothetical protein [Modestobacter sp. SYSU DS0290]